MICNSCGKRFEHIGNHWRYKPEHRPNISENQIEILTGILMGDGSLYRDSKNVSFRVGNTNVEYLEYLDGKFQDISNGVTLSQTSESVASSGFGSNNSEEYKDIYLWRTTSHPQLNKFRNWYSAGEKVWPEHIELTPRVLKNWYCCDGSTNDSGWIKFTLRNEFHNKCKIENYFRDSGLPLPNRWSENKDACWSVKNSKKLWKYMGSPLPGFEYKWPKTFK